MSYYKTPPHEVHRNACEYFRMASDSLGIISEALKTVGNDRLGRELEALSKGLASHERDADRAFAQMISDQVGIS